MGGERDLTSGESEGDAKAFAAEVARIQAGGALGEGGRLRELFEALFARAGLAEFAERLAELRRVTPPEKRREVLGAAVRGVRLDGELVLPPKEPKVG